MKILSSFILAGSMLATLFSTQAMAEQPYMQGALRALQNARASLETAATDKGGHRARAIQLVDEAIRQVGTPKSPACSASSVRSACCLRLSPGRSQTGEVLMPSSDLAASSCSRPGWFLGCGA